MCTLLSYRFANVANLMKHREEFHPDQTIKPPTGINQYACKFCDKVYRFALGLQKHVLTEHPSPSDNVTVLTCDQCPRKFVLTSLTYLTYLCITSLSVYTKYSIYHMFKLVFINICHFQRKLHKIITFVS